MVLQSVVQKAQESQTCIFLIDHEFVLPSVTFGFILWEATELYQSGTQKRADQQQVSTLQLQWESACFAALRHFTACKWWEPESPHPFLPTLNGTA